MKCRRAADLRPFFFSFLPLIRLSLFKLEKASPFSPLLLFSFLSLSSSVPDSLPAGVGRVSDPRAASFLANLFFLEIPLSQTLAAEIREHGRTHGCSMSPEAQFTTSTCFFFVFFFSFYEPFLHVPLIWLVPRRLAEPSPSTPTYQMLKWETNEAKSRRPEGAINFNPLLRKWWKWMKSTRGGLRKKKPLIKQKQYRSSHIFQSSCDCVENIFIYRASGLWLLRPACFVLGQTRSVFHFIHVFSIIVVFNTHATSQEINLTRISFFFNPLGSVWICNYCVSYPPFNTLIFFVCLCVCRSCTTRICRGRVCLLKPQRRDQEFLT